jgi:hypothetical protein
MRTRHRLRAALVAAAVLAGLTACAQDTAGTGEAGTTALTTVALPAPPAPPSAADFAGASLRRSTAPRSASATPW